MTNAASSSNSRPSNGRLILEGIFVAMVVAVLLTVVASITGWEMSAGLRGGIAAALTVLWLLRRSRIGRAV